MSENCKCKTGCKRRKPRRKGQKGGFIAEAIQQGLDKIVRGGIELAQRNPDATRAIIGAVKALRGGKRKPGRPKKSQHGGIIDPASLGQKKIGRRVLY